MFTRHRVPMIYSRAEVLSDAAVHAVGLVSALIAAPVLVTLAAVWFGDPTTVAAAAIYGLSLIAMFLCSAVYNHLALPARKDVLRRLDQSAIYVKIAGSYTPFAVLTGTHAGFFLAGVWGTAVLGASLIILSPTPLKWASILLYLALGWAGALIGGPMLAALSPVGLRADRRCRVDLHRRPVLLPLGAAAVPQHHLAPLRARGELRALRRGAARALRPGARSLAGASFRAVRLPRTSRGTGARVRPERHTGDRGLPHRERQSAHAHWNAVWLIRGDQLILWGTQWHSVSGLASPTSSMAQGTDVIVGLGGADLITALGGGDLIDAGSGNDSRSTPAGTGNDVIAAGRGNDVVRGGDGHDTVIGDNGNDRLFGDGGSDTLEGGAGDDRLVGGAGSDALYGNDGDDVLDGGGGNDFLAGGANADTFVYRSGDDAVLDFNPEVDILDLTFDLLGLDDFDEAFDLASEDGDDLVFELAPGDVTSTASVSTTSTRPTSSSEGRPRRSEAGRLAAPAWPRSAQSPLARRDGAA